MIPNSLENNETNDSIIVIFWQSARKFSLSKKRKNIEEFVKIIEIGVNKQIPIKIYFKNYTAEILAVEKASNEVIKKKKYREIKPNIFRE